MPAVDGVVTGAVDAVAARTTAGSAGAVNAVAAAVAAVRLEAGSGRELRAYYVRIRDPQPLAWEDGVVHVDSVMPCDVVRRDTKALTDLA